ncbi:hypothetical protein [Limosilactobacillus mucosae]|uniref:hypothetical protein n=1 Tax=Limosilactobacillus mucosae TaxID=97478 RepID=UPI003991D66E
MNDEEMVEKPAMAFVKTAPIKNDVYDNSKAHYYVYEGYLSRLVTGLAVGDNPSDPECQAIIAYIKLTDKEAEDAKLNYPKLPKLTNHILKSMDPILEAMIDTDREEKQEKRIERLLAAQPKGWKPAISSLKRKPSSFGHNKSIGKPHD